MPLINTRGAASIKGFGFAGFSPTVPGMPTSVSASATSSSAIVVSFTAPACNGGLSIDYYQAVCTGSGTHSATGSSPISITGLCASTSYTFKVRAHNSIGYGCYSSSTGTATTYVTASSSSYTSPGSYTFTAPTNVTSVSVVAVGGGGSSGGTGGSLGYKNNISTSPGSGYTVVVGCGGTLPYSYSGLDGGMWSYFINCSTVRGGGGAGGGSGGGWYCYGGTSRGRGGHVGDGGGCGGAGFYCYVNGKYPTSGTYNPIQGGGGAAGYSGNGGAGGPYRCSGAYTGPNNGSSGNGGGGAGGAGYTGYTYCCCGARYVWSQWAGYGGGGVGIFGQGSSGSGGGGGGAGGSGGSSGGCTSGGSGVLSGHYYGGNGGSYGGAGGSGVGSDSSHKAVGGSGAVRIMWPGNTRTFPSTSAGSP